MNQTAKTGNSTSDGVSFEISTDSGSTWTDVGVMENGYSWSYNFATSEREWGNTENPDKVAKNQKVTLSPSELATWDAAVLAKLSGGLMTTTAIPGTLVTGGSQTVSSGDWEFDKAIILDGQNASGAVTTIVSVTGSVDDAGAADDYTLVEVAGGWALVPLDGTNFTTEAQDLVIVQTYTPAAGTNVNSGSTSTTLTPFQARFTHWTDSGLTTYDFRHTIYRVNPDAGGITLNKLGSKSDTDYDLWTLALTGEIDTDRTDGEQLDTVYFAS